MAVDVPTFQELYDAGKSEVQARQPSLTDWNDGSNLDALTGAGAVQADEVIRSGIDQYAAQFIDTAEGDDLDALALDRFGLTRKDANAAVGTVRITLSTTDATIIPVGTSFSGSVNGSSVTVVSTAEATNIAIGSALIDVPCEATVTGPSGNIADGTIDTIDDDIGDSSATVAQAERFTGGTDAETDETFRSRIRSYFQTLRKGTVGALIQGALTIPGVRYAAVDESNIAPEDGGYVLLVIGDPDARASDELVDEVDAEIENWRAAGVRVDVAASERETISVTMVIRVRSGADISTLGASIRAAVVAYGDSLDPGATFYRSAAACAAIDVDSDIVDVSMSAPVADYTPTNPYNAVRVEPADLTVTFVEV